MTNGPEADDTSGQHLPQSKALHAFLLGLALCIRNTHVPTAVQSLHESLQYRVGLFQDPYMMEKFQLSDSDVADLKRIFEQFRHYLTSETFSSADTPEGSTH